MNAIDLDAIRLDKGAHSDPGDGLCLLEVVSMFAGEPFGDAPTCVSPVLRDFGIGLNDTWDDEQRQKLRRFIPLLPGTASDGQDEARSYLALDWLIRTCTPAWLDLAGLSAEAAELRSLRRIVDLAAAQAAGPVVRGAREKAAAAWAAAWDAAVDAAGSAAGSAAVDAAGSAAVDAAVDAARDAARDAAVDAARDAARDAAVAAAVNAAGSAARDAAWDAAGSAAWAAARAAARAAAGDALRPTVAMLQDSALDLFDRMINPAAVTA